MSMPRLNRRLTLESPGRVPDGAGGYEQTWTALGVVWAQLKARSGRETQVALAQFPNNVFAMARACFTAVPLPRQTPRAGI